MVINFTLIHAQKRFFTEFKCVKAGKKKKVRSQITNHWDKTNEKRLESCAQGWIVTL